MFKILRTGLRLIPTAIHAKKKITNLIKGNKKKIKDLMMYYNIKLTI
jgi:hypothetical protein